MPPEPVHQYTKFRHLLWWLVGGLLLLEGFSIFASDFVRDKTDAWLAERGLDFHADYFRVSLLDLSVLAVGVRASNREGRGFAAREVTLDYSWWQLLRGRAHLPRASVSGAYMDLQSVPGEKYREWEVGGWDLGEVKRRDRDFKMGIGWARIRDSELCYRHRPVWPTATCAYVGDAKIEDFLLGLWRKGDVPLKVNIAATDIQLEELLAREKNSTHYNTTLAHLHLKQGDFRWPSLRTGAESFQAELFSGCPPQKWADAIRGLQRLVGHCAAARRLNVEGDLRFGFGREGLAHWRYASGEGVLLRQSNQRWQDWRAGTITIRDFDFVRSIKRIHWRRGRATAFDWCPKHLRDNNHHFCIRATTLQVPEPTTFDWSHRLKITTGTSAAQQLRYLDVAQPHRQPLTAQQAALGSLEFDVTSRILAVDSLAVGTANGCVPGDMWKKPDHCVRLVGLRAKEKAALRFGSSPLEIPWGFASGPLSLAQLKLSGLGEEQLQLQKLKWRGIDTLGVDTPYSIQNFSLESLSGCMSRGLLPTGWEPLCAQLNSLDGRGNFAWQGGEDGYAIFGKLGVQRLLLGESRGGNKGLLLQKFSTGEGYFRREPVEDPWANAFSATEGAVGQEDYGKEKGRLRESKTGREALSMALASIRAPNFKLQSSSLLRLDGCLPPEWAKLIYRSSAAAQEMPACFDVRDLQQERPLVLAWLGGVDFATAELSIGRATAATVQNRPLLNLADLNLPLARIRIVPADTFSTYIALPESSVGQLHACLPDLESTLTQKLRCVELQTVQLGGHFKLEAGHDRVSGNLDDSDIEQLQLLGSGNIPLLEIQKLSIPELEFLWSGNNTQDSMVEMQDLSIESLFACLPSHLNSAERLPHCVFSKEIYSVGSSGLSIGETEFTSIGTGEPLWQLSKLSVDKIAFSHNTLDLYHLEIDNILICGLHRLLPSEANRFQLADCIETPRLRFNRGPVRIGLNENTALLDFGPMQTAPVAFWQKGNNYLQAGLQQMSWQRMTWDGDGDFSVTNFRLENIRVCLPDSDRKVNIHLLKQASPGDTRRCYGLDQLLMPGVQKISLSRPFSLKGSMELSGLSLVRRNTKPIRVPNLQLDNISFEGKSLIQVGNISGCLPAGLLKDRKIAPCYQLERLKLGKVVSKNTLSGRIFKVFDISSANIQMHAAGFSQALPEQLLKTESLRVRQLRFSSGSVHVQQLQLNNIASCIPNGYFDEGDHCFRLGDLELDGGFTAGQGLEFNLLKAKKVDLFSPQGELLVEGESITLSQFAISAQEWRFSWGEAVHFHFFNRNPVEPEYHRHSTVGDFRLLHIEGFSFDRRYKLLNVEFIDFLQPRFILVRDERGRFPIKQEIAELRGFKGVNRLSVEREKNDPLSYHIRDVHLRHGTFTWVDRQDEFRARLPVRDINLNLSHFSNLGEHPPAVLVANGRPGGFGDIQLGGTIDYLGENIWDADLTGYMENVNLIPATPYMAKLLGYKILQGQMDAVVSIHVRENQLNAFADVELEKIKVRRVRKDDQLPVKSKIIPLNVALWLLKDGQGNVKFGMPVTGNIRDPKFSLSFVFSELLQKAIFDALLSYLTPYGIYLLVKLAWGRFMAKDFDSIEFAPGSSELSSLAMGQLQQMVTVLHKHPKARPGVCGIANARDWSAMYPESTVGLRGSRRLLADFYHNPPIFLREEFEKLAQERSRKVERYLIDAGIPAAELIPCAPDYNGRDFGQPRVEFSN
ncbi:DUF748 domain-containing protein [Microbulbifer sp. VTAC004]|uniref:DUF748 domain-containing protein n=1 Tax=unclassified Microbulbifer TaxID=2619833 RepID=UPI00403984D6